MTADDAPARDAVAALPAEEAEVAEGSEPEGEAEAVAPLFPWWEAVAPAAPPAAPPSAEAPETPAPPARDSRRTGAASLIPLDLPEPSARTVEPQPLDSGLWERPAVIPMIPPEPAEPAPEAVGAVPELVAGSEAGALGRWEEAVAIPVIPPVSAEPVESLGEPAEQAARVSEESAATVAEELARATAALLAEIGEEPAVVEPLEPFAEASADEGLETPSWAPSASAVAEPPFLESDTGGDGGIPAPERLEAAGGGLVLPVWEPSAAEVAADGLAGDQQLPIPEAVVSEELVPEELVPEELVPEELVPEELVPEELVPESEVDEWVAFVEGLTAEAAAAARRTVDAPEALDAPGALDAPDVAEALADWEIGGAAAPASAAPRRRGWFRRRRPGAGDQWPEQTWAPEAGEEAPEPPPWAAGTAPAEALPQEALQPDQTPLLDDAAEAEAAWAAWEAGTEGVAGEAEEPAATAFPGVRAPEGLAEAAGILPTAADPFAPGQGELVLGDEEPSWEGAEWAGEPGAESGDLYAGVDEDEVEVPPAGLPEEEWEADDGMLWAAAAEPPQRPGVPPTMTGRSELEAEPEEDLGAAGWEAFPEPGRPLPYPESGVAPLAAGSEQAAPAAPEAEVLEGWETFPEPGTRAPGWSAGGVAQGPQPIPGPEPVFPEGEEEAAQEDEEAWAEEPGVEPGLYESPVREEGAVDGRTMEIPAPVFDFEGSPRLQRPISEEILAGAVTMEHRGLAEEVAAADTAETELQALSAPMPGLESGVVGFEDVAHLGSDEEMTAPVRSDLPIRVATGMVLALMLLGALWVGGEFFAGFVGLMAILGLGEFYGTLRRCGYQPLALFGFLGAAGMLAGTWFYGPVAIAIATVATVILSFFYYAFAPHRRDALTNGGVALLGLVWVIGTLAFTFPIAASPDFRVLILATAATVIATDVGAFFAGRSWGRRLMAPVLSPHKTWEGLAGGVVLGIGVAVGAGYLFDEIGLRAGAALGLVVAVMAPLGDLAESMVKRSLGVKDMGSILPGHGGILDRIDAFLFVLPAAWVLFETMGLLR